MSDWRDGKGLRWTAVLVACLSPTIPFILVLLFLWGVQSGPYRKQDSWMFELGLLACAAGVIVGTVGCVLGVVARTKLVALPAAVVGILLNVVVGFLALFAVALNGLAG
jgi:hypothetical protein